MRNLFPGRAGLQGILAVHLYECGYTELADGPTDIFGSILGESFDQDAVVAGLGTEEYRIQTNRFKFHACCLINHPYLDAVLEACRGEEFALEDVQAVDIITAGMFPGMAGGYPPNMLAAKFNVPYAVAAAVVRGRTDVTSFYPEALADERIRDLVGRVHIHEDPEAYRAGGDGAREKVIVRLEGGRTLEGSGALTNGNNSNRATREELIDKFHLLTDDSLGVEGAEAAIDVVDRLELLSDVREMTTLFGG